MGIGEIAPMVKAGLAGAGFLLGVMGVAAGGVLDQPGAVQAIGSTNASQPLARATPGAIMLSSRLQSGEEFPVPTAEVRAQAIVPTPVVQPTPRPTFVPKPYSAPAPPTTPSQAEQQQKLQVMEKQIADADRKLHTVTYVPPVPGAAGVQPQPAQQTAAQPATPASAVAGAQPADQTDMTAPDQTDQGDQTDQMSQ